MLLSPLRSSVEAATRAAKAHLRPLDHQEGWACWLHLLLEQRFEGGELLGASETATSAAGCETTPTHSPILCSQTGDEPAQCSPAQWVEVQRLVQALPTAVHAYPELLGWAYQAWQRDTKDTLQRRGARVTPEQVPAVTQLFTDAALVDALLEPVLLRSRRTLSPENEGKPDDNTPGGGLRSDDSQSGEPKTDEDAPTDSLEPDGPNSDSLTYVATSQLRLLDPCCGAGHVLLEAFRRLLTTLQTHEGWSVERAVPHILQHSLYGLELDPLCAEVASLTLALEAKRALAHAPDIWAACQRLHSPIASFVSASELERDDRLPVLSTTLTASRSTRTSDAAPFATDRLLHALARPLGSLLSPQHTQGAQRAKLQALLDEHGAAVAEAGALQGSVRAEGAPLSRPAPLSTALALLERRYDAVVTNVPFLARGKQSALLRDFCETFYPSSRHDLANVFLDRCLKLAEPEIGQVHVIMPQNWLFLTSYHHQRRRLLEQTRWTRLRFLGEGAFESSGAAGAFPILLSLQTRAPRTDEVLVMERAAESAASRRTTKRSAESADERWKMNHAAGNPDAAPNLPPALETQTRNQRSFLESADARITWAAPNSVHPPLSEYANAFVGLQTGDDPRYIRAFWELPTPPDTRWEPLLGTPTDFALADGDTWLVDWRQGQGPLHQSRGARPDQGQQAWNKQGIAIHRMRRIFAYTYAGQRFHQNIAVIVPKQPKHFKAVQAFCHSPAFEVAVRQLDQKLNVTNRTLTAVPFDLAFWSAEAEVRAETRLRYESACSENPHAFRQRDFQGAPPLAHAAEIVLARYLGFRWPTEAPLNEERTAQTPWYLCLHALGELRGDAPSQASPDGEHAVATFQRYFKEQSPHSELAQAPVSTLRSWLRDAFFEQHCRSFLERPFLWHLWDGESDGFSVIVRCHALDRAGLRTLIDTPLRAWIQMLDAPTAQLSDAVQVRLQVAATRLRERLEAIYVGEVPNDVFVRWKGLEEQAVGWDPNWSDGVRLLLRPFVDGSDAAGTSESVLRSRPRLSYATDRGNDGEASHWPSNGLDTGGRAGDRVNDHHVTLAEKAGGEQALDERAPLQSLRATARPSSLD